MDPEVKIGWSDFAKARNRPDGGHSWFRGEDEELLERIRENWSERLPGSGREDLEKVVRVPLPPERLVCSSVLVDEDTPLVARFERRQENEDGHVRVLARGPREEARHAYAVLYSAEALRENGGRRSGDFDWEIVALVASPVDEEPMNPLTMARNFLEKPGGTFCDYTARAFAEAIYYWSRRASALENPKNTRNSAGDG